MTLPKIRGGTFLVTGEVHNSMMIMHHVKKGALEKDSWLVLEGYPVSNHMCL
jgi:hypothetical protein